MIKTIGTLSLSLFVALPAAGLTISESLSERDITRERSLTQSATALDSYREDITFELTDLSLSPGDDVSLQLDFSGPLTLEGYFASPNFNLDLYLFNGPIISGSNEGVPDEPVPVGLDNATSFSTFSSGWDGSTFVNLTGSVAVSAPIGGNASLDGLTWDFAAPDWVATATTVDFRFVVTHQYRTDTVIDPERNLITFIPEPTSLGLVGIGSLALTRRRREA
jgi:hypothetical protein